MSKIINSSIWSIIGLIINIKWVKLEEISKYKNRISQFILLILVYIMLVIINILKNININQLGDNEVYEYLNINWGYDNISLIFYILTIFIGYISIVSNIDNIKLNYRNNYLISLLILILLMGLNFLCLDLISFYILFEVTLIPLYYIIGIYGAKNKNKASKYILVYTLGSSLFMLLSIIIIYVLYNSVDYKIISMKIMSIELQSIILIGIMIGLSVKTPLIPVHIWLPTVHSESPLGGSILLAGIILKLAIYGIIRLLLSNISEVTLLYIPIFYVIGIITIIYSSLITLKQIDLKVIIAYSSISHLGVCILGIFSNNLIGIIGSLVLCLAHGFVSPALFILMGGVLYDRFHNRILFYYQGLTQFMPIFAIYLVFFSFSNTGTPLSFNFIGEFLSITGAIIKLPVIGSLAIFSVLLSACYQMKLTNKLTSGIYSSYLYITYDLIYKEHFILLILAIPTLFFGIYPNLINNLLLLPSSSLIYYV